MMLSTLLLALPAIAGTPTVSWEAPARYIEGAAYEVKLTVEAPEEGGSLQGWALTPAGFTLDGKPVEARKGRDAIELAPGAKLTLTFDLAPAIAGSKAYKGKPFALGFDKAYSEAEAIDVKLAKAAPKGLNFMEMPPEELAKYQVVLSTNRGDMIAEFWPETAPDHVRNYLDLCSTGFYDGLTFHRVIPGFMIQGGDPTGTGSGDGPRKLKAEFSKDPKYKHVRGVLSMARSQSPDSASCQFFVMHATSPHLDGQYSAFGRVYEGLDVVDRIVETPRSRADKPNEKQFIKKATVIVVQ
jgi:peptidyl-prolyl cis-trans isomerase B (cyclophilin B)